MNDVNFGRHQPYIWNDLLS